MGAGRKRLGPPLPLSRGEGTALSGWYQREGRQKKKGRAEAETAAWMDAVVWKEEEEAEKGQYCACVGCSRVRRAVSTLVSSQRERRAMEKRYTIQTGAETKK